MNLVEMIEATGHALESVKGWSSAITVIVVVFLLVCAKRIPAWVEAGWWQLAKWRRGKKSNRRRQRLERQLKFAGMIWWTTMAKKGDLRPISRTRFDLIQYWLGDPVFIYVPYRDERYEIQPNGVAHNWFGGVAFTSVHELMNRYLGRNGFIRPASSSESEERHYMVWVYPNDAVVLFRGEAIYHANEENTILEPKAKK